MRILGIDPGTRALGYGLVVERAGSLAPGCFGVLEGEGAEPAALLLGLHRQLVVLLREVAPDLVAVERLFFNRNVSSAAAVFQARGVALLACAQAGLPLLEFTPGQVKAAVSTSGRASKGQVQSMVRRLLGLGADLSLLDDAADALAVAVCAHHHLPLLRLGVAP